ncbi:hypothetical protein JCM11641_005774 [Rhodosporidiobolus odoratus]
MTSVVSPPPSPPIPSSPGSLSSTSSTQTPSETSETTIPNPASPPFPTYTSLKDEANKTPAVQATRVSLHAIPSSSSSASVASVRTVPRRPGHRVALSMSHVGSVTAASQAQNGRGDAFPAPALKRRTHRVSDIGREATVRAASSTSSNSSTRTRTLSFSSTEQAFVPNADSPRLSASTSSATIAAFPFPHVEEARAPSPVHSVRLQRTATVPTRRPPRPTRQSTAPSTTSQTLRVPGRTATRTQFSSVETGASLEAKVVLLGSQGVGKTSLINRTCYGVFNRDVRASLGTSFHGKKLNINGSRVMFQIWDPLGQDKFRSLAGLYYRDALAAVLMYDVTDEKSLDDILHWLRELREQITHEMVILIVGAKSDLAGSYPTVPLETARRKVALWLHELDAQHNAPSPLTVQPTGPPPPSVRRPGQPRSRTLSTPQANASIPRSGAPPPITTSFARPSPSPPSAPPTAPPSDSFSTRLRKISERLPYSGVVQPPPPAPPPPPRPPPGLTPSFTMPDLSSYTLASLNLASQLPLSSSSLAINTLAAASVGMARASSADSPTSRGMVHSPTSPALARGFMALSSLASVAGGGKRLTPEEKWRKDREDELRKLAEEAEREEERIREIVDRCEVEVIEVSSKENEGTVFFSPFLALPGTLMAQNGWSPRAGVDYVFDCIATQLLRRREEIHQARILRSRDSIIIKAEDEIDTTQAGWCAC